jgi:UMF1 family MFS transporter
MLYTDGLNTVFNVGAVYAGVTFGMDFDELLLFGIALNVTAGIGAFGFGWIDDWLGAKRTILISVAALTIIAIILLMVETKESFWIFAMGLGLFFGPAQSASRSFMSRVAPPELVNEMFGLYAFSGKATAFLGPIMFGTVTSWTGSQRIGLASLLIFFVAGFILMLFVKDPQSSRKD